MACFSQTNGTSCNSLNGNGLRGKPLAGVQNTKKADGDARMPTAKYGMGCLQICINATDKRMYGNRQASLKKFNGLFEDCQKLKKHPANPHCSILSPIFIMYKDNKFNYSKSKPS